jgi:hypothetical protein
MNKLNPWVTGSALALALAVLYTACAGAFALAPQAMLEFFNAWFHGLNLGGMQSGAKPFTLGLFLYGLAGLSASAFVTGAVYTLFANWLNGLTTEKPVGGG